MASRWQLLLLFLVICATVAADQGSTTEEDSHGYISGIVVDRDGEENEEERDEEPLESHEDTEEEAAEESEEKDEEKPEDSSSDQQENEEEEAHEEEGDSLADNEEECPTCLQELDDIEDAGNDAANADINLNEHDNDADADGDTEKEVEGDPSPNGPTITIKRRVCVLHKWIYKRCRRVKVKRVDPKVCIKVKIHRTKRCGLYQWIDIAPPKMRKRRCVARANVCIKHRTHCAKFRVTHKPKVLCVRCCTCKGANPHACSCLAYKNGTKCQHGRLNVPYKHHLKGLKSDYRQSVQRALKGGKYKGLKHKFIPLLRYCIERKKIPARKVCVKYTKVCVAHRNKCMRHRWIWVIKKYDENGRPYAGRRKRVCRKYRWVERKYCAKYKNGAVRIIYITKCRALAKPKHVCLKYVWKLWKVDPLVKTCPCIAKEHWGVPTQAELNKTPNAPKRPSVLRRKK